MTDTGLAHSKRPKYLVLGGVKSGKSRHAQTLAEKVSSQVTLIVTAQALDEEMADRIQRHRDERPDHWKVMEEPLNLADALMQCLESEVVMIDCLTLWLTNLLMNEDESFLQQQIQAFQEAVEAFPRPLVLVSNETNMGIMPLGDLTRRYCDEAGLLHQHVAQACDQVELMVAGLPLSLKNNLTESEQ